MWEIKANLPISSQAPQNLDIHHCKSEHAITSIEQDIASSQTPGYIETALWKLRKVFLITKLPSRVNGN